MFNEAERQSRAGLTVEQLELLDAHDRTSERLRETMRDPLVPGPLRLDIMVAANAAREATLAGGVPKERLEA